MEDFFKNGKVKKILFVISIFIIGFGFISGVIRASPEHTSDFNNIYSSARKVWYGKSAYEERFMRHPPTLPYLLAPISSFPERVCAFIFLSLQIILLTIAIKISKKDFILPLFFSSPAIMDSLAVGQSNILAFVALPLISIFSKNVFLSSLSLSLAISIKALPSIFLIPLLLKKDFSKFFLTTVLSILFLLIPSKKDFFLWGKEMILGSIENKLPNDVYPDNALGERNLSLRRVLHITESGGTLWMASFGIFVLSMFLLKNRDIFPLMFLAMPIFSPITWGHYFSSFFGFILINQNIFFGIAFFISFLLLTTDIGVKLAIPTITTLAITIISISLSYASHSRENRDVKLP